MFVLLNIAKRKGLFDKTVRDGNFKDRNKLPKTIEVWKKNFLIMGGRSEETRLNSSHTLISYAVFFLKKKNLIP